MISEFVMLNWSFCQLQLYKQGRTKWAGNGRYKLHIGFAMRKVRKNLFAWILIWFCQKSSSRVNPAKAKSIGHAGKHLPISGDWYSWVRVLTRTLPCWCGSADCFLSDNLSRSRIGHNIILSPYVFESSLGTYSCIFMTECVVLDLSTVKFLFSH